MADDGVHCRPSPPVLLFQATGIPSMPCFAFTILTLSGALSEYAAAASVLSGSGTSIEMSSRPATS